MSFLCTANDYMILLVLLVLLFAFVAAAFTLVDKYNILWYLSTAFSFAMGIGILRAETQDKGLFIAVLVAAALAFSLLPTAKAYYVNNFFKF